MSSSDEATRRNATEDTAADGDDDDAESSSEDEQPLFKFPHRGECCERRGIYLVLYSSSVSYDTAPAECCGHSRHGAGHGGGEGCLDRGEDSALLSI